MTETSTVSYPHDKPTPPKRGRVLLIALGVGTAVIVFLVLGLLAGPLGENESAQSLSTTEAAPTTEAIPTTEAEPDYSTAQETLATWAAAIGTTDIDAAMATHSFDPNDVEGSREVMAYLGATVSHAEFNDCEFSTGPSGDIVARCDLTLVDPILAAIQMDTVPVLWRLRDDGRAILVSAPGDRLTAKNLFVPYAQERYPDEFAEACGPGTVNYNAMTGWAFNRACGEFTAQIANEVADAINEAG